MKLWGWDEIQKRQEVPERTEETDIMSSRPEAKGKSGTVQEKDDDVIRKNDIITLTDDKGNEIDFEFLDMIDYSSKQYAVLIPSDEAADQVVIFEVEDADAEDNVLTPVNDPDLAMAVFNLFKDRNREYYDFS